MNNNWTIEQTVELFKLCETARGKGESLSCAFRQIAERTSRSVNSVRNYYYGQAKTFELVPEIADRLGIKPGTAARERFVPFDENEVRDLLRKILIAKGRGISVRRAINEIACGDQKKALRLQNKYRSCLKSHRALVEEVVAELEREHMPCKNPFEGENTNFDRLTKYIASLDNGSAYKFLDLIEKLTETRSN